MLSGLATGCLKHDADSQFPVGGLASRHRSSRCKRDAGHLACACIFSGAPCLLWGEVGFISGSDKIFSVETSSILTSHLSLVVLDLLRHRRLQRNLAPTAEPDVVFWLENFSLGDERIWATYDHPARVGSAFQDTDSHRDARALGNHFVKYLLLR